MTVETPFQSPLPERYHLERRLGAGGGGQVWEATDLATGQRVALKGLHEGAGSEEVTALIRETIAWSGLEGLGFPRVLGVGRGGDGAPYLVRELIRGESFDALMKADPERALTLLPDVADLVTVVHRAGLLHGDIKPGNIISRDDGAVALVDLGLATNFREGGETALGLTPRYAAPEVRAGGPLTVQAEVYALGVILEEILDGIDAEQSVLGEVSVQATHLELSRRYPSVDELAAALRTALGIHKHGASGSPLPWPVLGLEGTAYRLCKSIEELDAGQSLKITGPVGSGRSTLLRRVGWELSLSKGGVVFLDAALTEGEGVAVGRALLEGARGDALVLLDAEWVQGSVGLAGELRAALTRGARLVWVGLEGTEGNEGLDSKVFSVSELDPRVVKRLLRGALPSLPLALVDAVVGSVSAYPQPLREFAERARGQVLASALDITRVLGAEQLEQRGETALSMDQASAEELLDRGRYAEARVLLDRLDGTEPEVAWLEARYQLAAGSAVQARALCEEALRVHLTDERLRQSLVTTLGRALLGTSQYEAVLRELGDAEEFFPLQRHEALAYRGLALSFLGQHEKATALLEATARGAEELGPRISALVHSSWATVEWRKGDAERAAGAYMRAIESATRAGDAGILASAQINLAGLRKEQGDMAASYELLEAAADTAALAGRLSSVRQALLNLTNSDLYLGRVERARANLSRVTADGTPLSASQEAQVHGLWAEVHARLGEVEDARDAYRRCENAWAAQGRRADAAEAALEALLVLLSSDRHGERRFSSLLPTEAEVSDFVRRGREFLEHKETPLLLLAEARALEFQGAAEEAERAAERAAQLALDSGQREWAWRALSLESELLEAAGRHTRARRAAEKAVEILEEIGARLPTDLREVYWNEPRRRALREWIQMSSTPGSERSRRLAPRAELGAGSSHLTGTDAITRMSETPLERRLSKILAINTDLAIETDFGRLATKIVAHATELLGAERGYLLLGESAEALEVVASRAPDGEAHRDFSRSVARLVLKSGVPFFSVDASADQRLQRFESVHHVALSAVACVPILSAERHTLGAIYAETRAQVAANFASEVPTLQAFADQAAIAIETRRLVGELAAKTQALEEQNQKLSETQARLKELLTQRTERLQNVRRELKKTKEELGRVATYGGLVGSSRLMHRVYELIERVRRTDVPVLLTGESGTGKEVVARAIHEGSSRTNRRMLAVNCGAIPETILESELFGHVRGAFTGADRERKGLFQEADGGTLLLDEVGETPIKMQASLLRVLQEQKVRPVGSALEVPVDVRVIFATNRDLADAVRRGTFREDLLYRIQVVEIALPPLRERLDDVPLLVDHFLSRFAVRFGGEKRTLQRDALARLMAYDFPGNVRQLENLLLNAWVMSEGDQISADDLTFPEMQRRPSRRDDKSVLDRTSRPVKKGTLSEHQRDERSRMVDALDKTGWNRVRAAELLGMPRRTFYRRLREYGLQ